MRKKEVNIDDVDLEKLSRMLKHGDRKKVIERTGYSKQYVYFVLNPGDDRMNKEIVQAAIQVIEEGRKIEIEEDLAKSLVA